MAQIGDQAKQMIGSHKAEPPFDAAALARCIDACFRCEQACTMCADACLSEEKLDMLRRCIRVDLDCADACTALGRMLSRLTEADEEVLRTQLHACAVACRVCAEECEKHASKHGHCKVCAQACRDCESSCHELLGGKAA